MNLLLMSNSTNHGGAYLGHVRDVLADYLEGVRELVFVPYALHDWDGYTRQAAQAFGQIGISVRGAHTVGRDGLESAPAIFVGGGNTFRLVRELQRRAESARREREKMRRVLDDGLAPAAGAASAPVAR